MILDSNSASGGYDIDNSLKLEADNSENLYRNLNASTSTTKFTHSMWVKRTELVNAQLLYMRGVAGNESTLLRFSGESGYEHGLQIDIGGSSTNARSVTTRKFRDTSAWYHFVLAVDTTQSTAANRRRLYVNGVEETVFGMNNTPSQNFAMEVSSAKHRYGAYNDTENYAPFSGYIAECHYIDGSQLDATSFGEFDDDSGIWKPKQYTGSYGTGGYYLDFSDSSDLGANAQGDDVNFTLRNIAAADQATDTPTNNFNIFFANHLFNESGGDNALPREGNTVINHDYATGWATAFTTISVSKGKWYAEFEATNISSKPNVIFGVINTDTTADETDNYIGSSSGWGVGIYMDTKDVFINNGASVSATGNTISNGDIIGVALDMDNNFAYFSINNQWITNTGDAFGGDPTSGSTGTGGYAIQDADHMFAVSVYNPSSTYSCNFGGHTKISLSSAASDANGYGNFEYAPPSGYYALCTKNLAEYG